MHYRIWHLRRSGGHAVQYWLVKHLRIKYGEQNVKRSNDIKPHKFQEIMDKYDNPIQVVNLENRPLAPPRHDTVDIVVLRDIANTLASTLKRNYKQKTLFDELWMEYYNSSSFKVLYNKWHLDPQYRGQLLVSLGLNYDESPYDLIPAMGGGSSWTGRKCPASEMDVLHRYEQVDRSELLARLAGCPNSVLASYAAFKDTMTDKMMRFYDDLLKILNP